jgi:hypothetical protein
MDSIEGFLKTDKIYGLDLVDGAVKGFVDSCHTRGGGARLKGFRMLHLRPC